ncbi:hypothetical protein [Pedobacter nanyangensis]|uniref:hypothetical protein n=1 Tax=Pedobacter nanyangensis TaxID=1562389 RepID=UPI000DE1FA32|nr:hypothetical protein [Pedobacter nanyangensis]
MNKQNLLSRAEMKKVMGGNITPEVVEDGLGGGDANDNVKACSGKTEGSSCSYSGKNGTCVKGTWTSLYCNVPG